MVDFLLEMANWQSNSFFIWKGMKQRPGESVCSYFYGTKQGSFQRDFLLDVEVAVAFQEKILYLYHES